MKKLLIITVVCSIFLVLCSETVKNDNPVTGDPEEGPCDIKGTMQDTIYHKSADNCCSISINGNGFTGDVSDNLQFSSGDCVIVVNAEGISDGSGSFHLLGESGDTLYTLELNTDKIIIETLQLPSTPKTNIFSTSGLDGRIVIVLAQD